MKSFKFKHLRHFNVFTLKKKIQNVDVGIQMYRLSDNNVSSACVRGRESGVVVEGWGGFTAHILSS